MPDLTSQLSTAVADRYRILSRLGEGGMATVYLAEDLKHDRKVALKVLRPELAAVIGAERFLAEIKTTANLQHPNILPLFDSGDADGQLFYVMPYVEGESLRDRLNREKQLPVSDAVTIAKEVASALDYAHRHGVIHRDIKPENVMLHDGRALVADFGIALALSGASGTRMTETGMSLGTPHYMSPEQAMGEKEITAKSDVYALGAMLYEMLVGEPPFTGPTAQAIIARVVTEQPRALTIQRNTIPPEVEEAALTALQKLPADRFATAAEFADALEGRGTGTRRYTAAGTAPAAPATLSFTHPLVLGLATTALVAIAIAAWGWLRPTPAPPPSLERILLGTVTSPSSVLFGAAVAPDGSAIVYTDTVGGKQQLWIKERGTLDPRPLAPIVDQDPPGPSFSPDGQWIVYSNGALQKIARRGGAAIQLSDSAAAFSTAWLEDGTIAFIGRNQDRIFTTSADGGGTRRVLTADAVHAFLISLSPVPHRRAVLVTVAGTSGPRVVALDLTTDSVRDIGISAGLARLVRDELVYVQPAGQLLSVPFDTKSLTARGTPTSVLQGVRTVAGTGDMVAGADGTLLYAEGAAVAAGGSIHIASVTRDGTVTPLDTNWTAAFAANSGVGLSPDGSRLALSVSDSATGNVDIYIVRLATGIATRLTFDGLVNIRPVWSADGTRILFSSSASGTQALWIRRADGSGQATPVHLSETRPIFEGRWSPDGEWIVYRTDDAAPGNGDIYAVRTQGDTTPVTITATSAEETGPAVSPDGKWIAYASNATGRKEIYVRPFPNATDGMWQVSSDGGSEVEWSHTGKELFYRNANGDMIAVAVSATPTFTPGAHKTLFNTREFVANDDSHVYAVMPDDKRFLLLRIVDQGTNDNAGRLVLVRNWMGETQTAP